MKYRTMQKLLLGGALFGTLASTQAQAGTISGNLVADNNAIVVVEETPGNFQVVTPSATSWPAAKSFNFNIKDMDQAGLKQCRVHIIAWGDGAVAQGIAAWFTGAPGYSAYTGQSGKFSIRSAPNATTGGSFPGSPALITNANAASILGFSSTSGAPAWTSPGTVAAGGISGTWGPVTMPLAGASLSAYPTDFRFIWDNTNLDANPSNYRIATTSCGYLQPVIETPIGMPGNHWQCYRVQEGPTLKPESLVVRDQFGKAEIVLARPLMLCNPSMKVHGDKKYDIEFKERHLVCYQPIKQSDQQTKRKVKINNQMSPATLILAERQMFCVPSSKKRLDAPDLPVGGQMD
jgi:hypothetical protein